MKQIVIGDYDTLAGTPEKPSKVLWLRENGIRVDGVQIISLPPDLLPRNLENFGQKMADLLEKIPNLKRLSVAILCWPHMKKIDDDKNVVDVAVSNMLTEDLYTPAFFICKALQELHITFGIAVDISYHPMLTVPTCLIPQLDLEFHQQFLWNCEVRRRQELVALLEHYKLTDVGINIENEPVTSDQWGNLTHMGNRLFSEQVNGLPSGWGVTADLQHCAMILECLKNPDKYPLTFPPLGYGNSDYWNWEAQFVYYLPLAASHSITFHVAQMEDPMHHITPLLKFDDPIMNWPKILRLMKELDELRGGLHGGNVWYAPEQDGGHIFPAGYEADLVAFQYLQNYFEK